MFLCIVLDYSCYLFLIREKTHISSYIYMVRNASCISMVGQKSHQKRASCKLIHMLEF